MTYSGHSQALAYEQGIEDPAEQGLCTQEESKVEPHRNTQNLLSPPAIDYNFQLGPQRPIHVQMESFETYMARMNRRREALEQDRQG